MRSRFFPRSSRFSLITAITTLTAVVSIFSFASTTYASVYAPGQTLDPDCAPGSSSCGVEVPLTTTAIQNNVSDGLQVTGGGGLAVQLDGSSLAVGTNGLKISDAYTLTYDKLTNGAGVYLNYKPNNTACSDGGVMKYDATNDRWICGSDNVGSVNSGSITSSTSGITITGGTGAVLGSGVSFSIATADSATNGLLSSTDWTTFNGKEDAVTGSTTGTYYRGDKTWQTLNKSAVDLSNVENTALSTWDGSSNITTLGTIATGTWHGSDIALGTYTSGNYVADATTNGGLILTGTEGGTLGVQLDGSSLALGANGLKVSDSYTIAYDMLTNSSGVYLNYKPNNVACSEGGVMKYDATNDRWICGSDNVGSVTSGSITSSTSGITITGGTGAVLGSGVTFSVDTASATNNGLLSSTDWTTFNGKEDAVATSTTGTYYRGDKTWQTLNKAAVGLSNVENTALSTWSGSSNLTTLGTITTGTWHGSDIALGTYTSGNYVADATINGGLVLTGTEGASLGIQLNGATLSLAAAGLSLNLANANTWTGLQTYDAGVTLGTGSILNANSNKITNLATPTSASDAANKAYIDSFVSGITWQNPVINLTASAAPGSPTTGDRYILQAGASGFGSCTTNQIAQWSGSAWGCTTPATGWTAYASTPGSNYNYNGTTWVSLGSTVNHATLSNLQGGQSGEYYHLNASDYGALTSGNAQLVALQTTGSPTFAGLTVTGAITAPTTGNTINGLVVNAGALSKVTSVNGATSLTLSAGTGDITFTGSLIPSVAATYDIGSAANPIRDLYVSNNSIKVGGVSLSNSSGTLTWAGGAIQATSGSSSFDSAAISTLNATTANITALNLAGALNVPGNFSVGTNKFNVASGSGNTAIAGTLGVGGAITAPTSVNTINGLVVNSGALSAVTGIAMASGDFAQTGTGTFSTGTGAVSLNGDVALASGKGLSLAAATAGKASLNIATSGGTDPTTPTSGDLWWNGTNLYFYNGTTRQDLLGASASACSAAGCTFTSTTTALTTTGTNGSLSLTSNGTGALTLDSGTTGAINIGTNANAKTITIGNNTGASSLALVTGTGGATLSSTTLTGTGLTLNVNALTSGKGLAIASTGTTTTGNLLSVTSASAGAFTNGAMRLNITGAHTGVGFQIDDNTTTAGGVMSIAANALAGGYGLMVVSTGAAGTGNLLNTYSGSTASFANGGVRFQFAGNHTGNGVQIDDITTAGTAMSILANSVTTGTGLQINTAALTSGKGLNITSNSSLTTGNMLQVYSQSTAAFTNGAVRFYFINAHTGNGVQLDDSTATGNAMAINVNNLSTGNGLVISSSLDTASGKLLYVNSYSTNYTAGGVSFNFGGAHTGAGMLIQDSTLTGTASAILANNITTGTGLHISASSANFASTNGLLYVVNNSASTSGTVARIAANSTAGSGLTVLANGKVGIGTVSPTDPLSVFGNIKVAKLDASIKFYGGTSSGVVWTDTSDVMLSNIFRSSSNNLYVSNAGTSNTSGVYLGLNGTSWLSTSDARLKTNYQDYDLGLSTLMGLRVRTFDWKASGTQDIGFIAQEVYQVDPDAVSKTDDGVSALDGSATPWGVNYNRIVVLAVKAIQDQQAIINGIKTDTDAIKNGMATTLTLNSLTVNGGLSVKGDADFAGKVKFTGQVSFNSDTAGTATIHSGDSEVRVEFKQQLDAIPVVNATPLGIVSSKYGVKDVTQQGFTIVIDPAQPTDAIFNWMAIQPNTTQ